MGDKLNNAELHILEWLLPNEKPFYNNVFNSIASLPVTSRSDDGQILLGTFDEAFSERIAIGEVRAFSGVQQVSVAATDDLSGFSLHFPTEKITSELWTLSAWSPGETSPVGNSVREVTLVRNGEVSHVLALSPSERVVWLHHIRSGYNQLLPLTGIFVELARMLGRKQGERVQAERLSHEAFFSIVGGANDLQLSEALLSYNKRTKKFDAGGITPVKEKRRGIRGFFDLGNFFDRIRR